MSRYEPLAQFLAAKKGNSWEASFDDVEARLGKPLPESAYKYPAWWANQSGPGHSQTRGWRSVGWRTCDLDLERRRVRFEREPGATASAALAYRDDRSMEELLARARELTGIGDRDSLIREALRLLVAREAGMRLARLGGTMPEFNAPPRERPFL
jgi:hypothetical protein